MKPQFEDPKGILKELDLFFTNLCTKKSLKSEEECLEYLANINTPTLTNEDEQNVKVNYPCRNV